MKTNTGKIVTEYVEFKYFKFDYYYKYSNFGWNQVALTASFRQLAKLELKSRMFYFSRYTVNIETTTSVKFLK